MNHIEQWIWLPKDIYKNEQTTVYSGFNKDKADNYTVAEFKRTYTFSQKVVRASLRFSGDTAFQLFCNDRIVATGPACVGGDFLGNETVRDNFYSFGIFANMIRNLIFLRGCKCFPIIFANIPKDTAGSCFLHC